MGQITYFEQSDNKTVTVRIVAEYSCYGCQYFGREYENNDIRCNCRKSKFYRDVPPGDPCNHWRPKE